MKVSQSTTPFTCALWLRTPRPATGVFRARSVPGSVPGSVPKTGGVRRSVPRGVSGTLRPRAPECQKSVPRVSPECQKDVPNTPGTLSGHSLVFWTLRSPGSEGSRRHPVEQSVRHPPFSGTLSGTLPGTLRVKDSCSWPGSSQPYGRLLIVCLWFFLAFDRISKSGGEERALFYPATG